ncbi:hypothetical protein PRUPE_6G353000 [Prunus persica]|uniref:LOW protein: ammonium transporter 1-like protein n=1 Tax=Prunus persica TaxID=3760 RepID=A0A251P0D2_PRUPE|nr:hypothetical protein PRUPE_6G353000 [Prunus persica]
MASLTFLQPLSNLSSPTTLVSLKNPHHIPSFTSLNPSIIPKTRPFKSFTASFSLAESNSPKSLQPNLQPFLQELADSFDLPQDYFAQLPSDLRLDLNDAAFDLSNGRVIDECGQELGETLLNLSRAWEAADTSTSHALARQLPGLEESLTGNAKSAFGKRLVSAGRRFQSMGQYGQGELQKFGELQLELTSDKAIIGAIISVGFGILSWELAQGIQNIPESSLQYANENALMLAKSLRGALLAVCYSSAFLSALTSVGLVLLGRQLKSSKEK